MKANTVNVLSTVAISVGSFLLGSSFGISFASRNCEKCTSKQPDFTFGQFTVASSLDKYGNIVDYNLDDEESWTEYKHQAAQYSSDDTDGDEPIRGRIEDPFVEELNKEMYESYFEDEEDDSYTNTIKEITVGDEIVEVKQTEYGTEEVGEPYVISEDSYEYEYEDFAKEDLVYFDEDGVLIDDKDEIVDNPDRYIGSEALNSFGEGSTDEDIVYVRNLRYSIDYRIVREHTSYRENVLGLTEEGDKAAYEAALRFANTKNQNANIRKE